MATTGRRLLGFLALTAGAAAIVFAVGAPPERCPDVDTDDLLTAATGATGWLVDSQRADGRWLYEYDRVADAESDDYNVVRHAGVMSSLYQASARGIDGAFDSAERGLEWALANTVERHGWIGMTTGGTVQAGTNALLLAALAERRLQTDDPVHDEVMRGLATFLVEQVEPSGALLAFYDLEPDRPRADTYSIYYTGEAWWALARLHRIDPDGGWGEVADRMGRYIATERDVAEDIWPPLADHWSGYGLAETAAFPERPPGAPLTDEELAYARRQGALIGQRVRSISQRFGPWGPLVRGTFTPRGGGYGVFGEGLAGLWRTAQLDDRLSDERGDLAERARCISGLAIDAQVTPTAARQYPAPDKVAGAWFIDEVTRMDDQQHALSALLLTIPIVEAAPYDPGHPAPSWWLWLIVVAGLVNPARAAPAVPGSTRRERIRLTVAGGIGGAILLVAVGALSGLVLDAVGASRPAIRLSAAALCLLTAGIDLVRRPRAAADRRPEGSPWESAVVDVALPFVARPALVLAGLAAVADHGLVGYAVAVAVAVAALVATVAAVPPPTDDRPGPVSTWCGRLLSGAAVVASVLLIADAVFAI